MNTFVLCASMYFEIEKGPNKNDPWPLNNDPLAAQQVSN